MGNRQCKYMNKGYINLLIYIKFIFEHCLSMDHVQVYNFQFPVRDEKMTMIKIHASKMKFRHLNLEKKKTVNLYMLLEY